MKEKIEFLKQKAFQVLKISGIPFIISFLGTYAGSQGTSKNWRRLGIPFIFCLTAYIIHKELIVLFLFLQYPVLTIGHGIPSKDDEGSFLGRFYLKYFSRKATDYFVRGTIAFFLCLSFLGVIWVKQNWLEYFICSTGIIFAFSYFQWRSMGSYIFVIKGKVIELLVSDAIAYGALGILGIKMIV